MRSSSELGSARWSVKKLALFKKLVHVYQNPKDMTANITSSAIFTTITEWQPVDSHFVTCSCIVSDGNFLGVLATDCNIFDMEGALARLCNLQ